MPPSSGALLMAPQHGVCEMAVLPQALLGHILSLLPVDERLRASEVCPAWYALLACDKRLWARLDFCALPARFTLSASNALLRAAAKRAGGQLQALDTRDCLHITDAAVLEVVAANAGSLRELAVGQFADLGSIFALDMGKVDALLAAAPQLQTLHVSVKCGSIAEARRVLRGEGSFAPLRVRHITIEAQGADTEAAVHALAADLAVHASLTGVTLVGLPLNGAAALDAIVGAVLTRRLADVTFENCSLAPASIPALARLLRGGALTSLSINGHGAPLLDVASAPMLADALRASALDSLALHAVSLWRDAVWLSPDAGVAVLGALTGHATLKKVFMDGNPVGGVPQHQEAVGAALGALVASASSQLTCLHASACDLRDAALSPLFDALGANTRLTELLATHNLGMSEACALDHLLPAVRANTALNQLSIELPYAAVTEAEELARGRMEMELMDLS